MHRRPLLRDYLAQKLREIGTNPGKVAQRATEKGYPIGKSTINDMLNGGVVSPSLDKLEAVAVGMDLSPEEFIANLLGSRADNPSFKGSQFAMLHEIYKSMTQAQRKLAEPHIEGLLFQLQRIKRIGNGSN